MAMRVVAADDDDGVRAALCALLDDDARFEVVGQARDGAEAVELVDRLDPDIVLLDVRMAGGGAEVADAIRARGRRCTTIAVSSALTSGVVAGLLAAGVRGMFSKERLGPGWADLVARCHHGEVILAVPTAAEGLRLFAQRR
jgi:DNA-binding NarL/FixJ family response regulator